VVVFDRDLKLERERRRERRKEKRATYDPCVPKFLKAVLM